MEIIDNFKFRVSSIEDALELAQKLRKEDLQEVLAAGNKSAFEALYKGLIYSSPCISFLYKNKVNGMFGLIAHNKAGIVWFLGGPESIKHPLLFTKYAKKYINLWLNEFNILHNYVYSKNIKHIKWLKFLGFKIDTENIKLINNNVFYYFSIKKG